MEQIVTSKTKNFRGNIMEARDVLWYNSLINKDVKTKSWTFDNDELFNLVACGRKRGTCCLFDTDENMSKVGDINIIYNSRNEQIKIHITNVRKSRFCDVDDEWAKTEGEGDLTLQYWQRVHREFFRNIKSDFNDTDILELNEFKVI